MRKEEAIQLLKEDSYMRCRASKDEIEALDVAIEALSAEVNLYALPKAITVRPLTEEIAIEFLQDSGWLQKHDKEIGNPPMLVRCKDCRHYAKGHCYMYGGQMNDDDYCSHGERQCNYFGERREP